MKRGAGVPKKSAARIDEEIRGIRADLGLTFDALADQLAPRQLVGKGIDMITQSIKGNGVLRVELGEAARANRLPLALIGAGVAWLLARNLGTAGSGRTERAVAAGERGAAGAHQVEGAIRSVRDTGGAVLEYAGHAKEQARRAGGSLRATFERHPLLIGLVGVGAGAALAGLLPATKRERDWVGETREELWGKAEKVGHEVADGVRSLAEHRARATDG
jgi:Protein of unknown function (DUF3618)